MKITWLGHASFQIRSADKRIYIDPYDLRGQHKPADIILLTHDHYEHCDKTSIKKLSKPNTQVLGSESAAKRTRNCGILRPGDAVHLDNITIKAVHAYNLEEHSHPPGQGVGFIIEHDGHSVYHAGDTDLIPEMSKLGSITLALLPVSGTYTMDADEASKAAKLINPKIAVPMHYGKVAGSRSDADRFKAKVEKDSGVKVEFLEEKPLWV